MKVILLLGFIATVRCAYTDVDPNYDYDAMLANPAEEQKFMDCFLNLGPCSDIMGKIKGHLLETVQDACKQCDDKQKRAYHKFLVAFRKLNLDEFNQFKAKYDLDGKHFNTLEKELDKY